MLKASPTLGIVTTSFPRFEGDPAGSFVLGLALEMARLGKSVEVVVPEPSEEPDWGSNPDWLEGIRVFRAPYVRPRHLGRLFFGAGVPDNLHDHPSLAGLIPGALLSLFAVSAIRARMWDGVLSHWLIPSAIIAGRVRRSGTRHLAFAHSADVHLLKKLPLGGSVAKAVVQSADDLGFVSTTLKDEFLSLLSTKFAIQAASRSSVTPMGFFPQDLIPLKARKEVRQKLGLFGFTVLFIGRLVPIKGVDLLIDAVAGADGLQLVIAGDGPMGTQLKRQARARGVNAHFLGWVDAQRRADLLRSCDAMALPSRVLPNGRHEGLPLTLVEALAGGCPVVAAATGGVTELVEDRVSGLLFPPDQPQSLRNALEQLRDDPMLARRLAQKGRDRVKNRSFENLAKRYERLVFEQV